MILYGNLKWKPFQVKVKIIPDRDTELVHGQYSEELELNKWVVKYG